MQTRVREVQSYLADQGLKVRNFATPTPTSVAAAEAVGCQLGEIAKSILLMVGKSPVLVVTSGDTRVKSGRLKKASQRSGSVKLPKPEEVLRHTGYEPGAVSPFLLPSSLPVYLDKSLQRYAEVFPAAGSSRSAVAVDFQRLQDLCDGQVVDVCDIQDDRVLKGD